MDRPDDELLPVRGARQADSEFADARRVMGDRDTPDWQRPLADRPNDSYRRLRAELRIPLR
jgi:hypothetical protein